MSRVSIRKVSVLCVAVAAALWAYDRAASPAIAGKTEGTIARLQVSPPRRSSSKDKFPVENRKPTGGAVRIHIPAGPRDPSGIASWSQRDPIAALRWLEAQGRATDEQITCVVRTVVERNEEEWLAEYLDSLASDAWRQRILVAACEVALAQQRIDGALRWLERFSPDQIPTALLQRFAFEWGEQDYEGAARWACNQPDSSDLDDLIARIAEGYAAKRPKGALYLALEVFPAGATQNRVVANIVARWSERSMTEASSSIPLLPDGPVREEAIGALLESWADYDLAGAWGWALAKPKGRERDFSVRRLATLEAAINPERAATLAEIEMSPGQFQQDAIEAMDKYDVAVPIGTR